MEKWKKNTVFDLDPEAMEKQLKEMRQTCARLEKSSF